MVTLSSQQLCIIRAECKDQKENIGKALWGWQHVLSDESKVGGVCVCLSWQIRSLWEKDVGRTRLTPLPLRLYHSQHQSLASRVESILFYPREHSINLSLTWRPGPVVNLYLPDSHISICTEHKCRGRGGRGRNENTGRSVKETCLSFTPCAADRFISAVILRPLCARAHVCVHKSRSLQIHGKRNTIVNPFFQIGFPNLECCTVTVISWEHAVSLVLLSLWKNRGC